MDEKTILIDALAIASPEDRADFLNRACGDDRALFDRVQALLKAHEDAGSLLDGLPEAVPTTGAQPPAIAEKPGTRIGRASAH